MGYSDYIVNATARRHAVPPSCDKSRIPVFMFAATLNLGHRQSLRSFPLYVKQARVPLNARWDNVDGMGHGNPVLTVGSPLTLREHCGYPSRKLQTWMIICIHTTL